MRDGIVAGWQEAIDMADNAVNVMIDHATDAKVQTMCKYILGVNDFDNKFNQVKGKFLNYVP